MSAPNVTYMRCFKVEQALEKDPGLRKLLGPKEHIMHKTANSAPCKFSGEVIAITQAIHQTGLDTFTMTKREIRLHAMRLFRDHLDGVKPLPKVVIPEPEPEPQEAPAPKPAPKAKKPVAAAKPKTKPKPVVAKAQTKPKTKPKTKPVEEAEAPVEEKSAPVQNGPPPRHEAPQAELGQTREEIKELFTAPVEQSKPAKPVTPLGKLPVVWGVGVNSLLGCCLTLLEAHGMQDSPIFKRLNELTAEVDKLTVLPPQFNAKESQNSSRTAPA